MAGVAGLLEGEIEETAPSALHHPSSIWTQPPLTFALSHSLVRHPFILLLCAALLLLFSSELRVSNPNCSPLSSLSRSDSKKPALPCPTLDEAGFPVLLMEETQGQEGTGAGRGQARGLGGGGGAAVGTPAKKAG